MPDFIRLKSLLGHDDAMVARFLGMLRTDLPLQSAALQEQTRTGDWAAVSNTAHTLKGYLKYVSEEQLAETAYQIESAAENGPVPEDLIQELTNGLASLLQAL